MAIRRPPTTFSDTISTADIADDAITGGKLANDIAISTTGNIATTGSGTLTVAGNTTLSGTNNLGSNPTVTLGSNTTFPTTVTDRTYWYKFFKDAAASQAAGDYSITPSLDFSNSYVSGCAPVGFTSVVSISAWYLALTHSGGYSGFDVFWDIGHEGSNYATHANSFTKTTSGNYGANNIRHIDLLNGNNNGQDFEDHIAEGDVFGFRVKVPSMNNPIYGLGIKIVWRF